MPERVSWQRMVITFVVITIAVILVVWAVVALSAWIIGPVSGDTPAALPPKVAPKPAPVAPVVPATPSVPATPTTATVPATSTGQAPQPQQIHAIVAIDPGHQGQGDPSLEPEGPGSSVKKPKVASGASGWKSHTPESVVNLAVGLKLRDVLQSHGVTVVMTRTRQDVNVSNSERAQLANSVHSDIFVRLHCDGIANHTRAGLSTLVPQSNKWTAPIVASSRRAGGFIEKAAVVATHAKNLGVVNRGDLSGFNWSKVPSVLVEMGFLSNAAEDRRLNSSAYQDLLAKGIANGILNYLRSTGK